MSGSRENVVRLEATHSDLSRFDEHDYDNSKVVLSNIEDLYEHAISTCKTPRACNEVESNLVN